MMTLHNSLTPTLHKRKGQHDFSIGNAPQNSNSPENYLHDVWTPVTIILVKLWQTEVNLAAVLSSLPS